MGKVYTNNNKKMYMILGAGIVMIIIAAVLFFILTGKSETSVLKDYYAMIEEKNYEGMYDLLSSGSKEANSKENFIERNKKIYEGIEAKDIEIEIQEEKDDALSYQVTMKTVAGEAKFENTTYFEDKSIVWEDRMIHPSLSKDSKVRVSTDDPVRGEIKDRNGVVLAGEGNAYQVGLVRGKLNGENDYDKLAKLLSLTKEGVQKTMSASWIQDDSFVPLKTISYSDIQLKEQLLTIPGVKLTSTTIRTYPYGEITSHMLGYLQKVNAEDLEKHKGEGYSENSYIGRSGIEAAYEKELKGTTGKTISIVDKNGKRIDTIAEMKKEDGKTIDLTIDINLQKNLYNAFQKDKSASVALNPQTGEVLALVSTPSFSSNDFILGMSTEKWDQMNNDKNLPLSNRFKSAVVPGSSMKPITAAIGLDSKKLDAHEDLKAEMKWQKDSSWGGYYVTTLHAPKPNNLKNAMVQSDNVYFAKAALRIGADNLEKGYKQLKIGEKIPFELALNKSQYTSKDFKDDIQVADSGYGQGEILMNPVQMASIYGAFVNDGNMMTPRLLKSTDQSVWVESAFTKETCDVVKDALIGVVNEGTGKAMKMNGVTLAGKTGTGEIKASQDDTTGSEIGWFTVMTTDSSRPVVISTMVEDVKNRGGSSYVVNHMKDVVHSYVK